MCNRIFQDDRSEDVVQDSGCGSGEILYTLVRRMSGNWFDFLTDLL
jgi:hypothetical protein